jgi:hypothetical protein
MLYRNSQPAICQLLDISFQLSAISMFGNNKDAVAHKHTISIPPGSIL